MFAHRIAAFTGPDDVVWTEVPEPSKRRRRRRRRGRGGGVLRRPAADQGRVPDAGGFPYTPGMDAAGVVRSAARGLGLLAGQRVAVLVSYGCWQEVISAPAERVLPLPDGMSFEAGAAAPLNYLTGLFALVRRARALAGETLLVHGAAGGVGTAAVQLGRRSGCGRSRSPGTRRRRSSRCGAARTTRC